MEIVIGIIRNSSAEVLITQRGFNTSFGGYWEFPGGKCEHAENSHAALVRELAEEVGIKVEEAKFLKRISTETKVFKIFEVNKFRGIASCCESQLDLRWVALEELEAFKFPPSNYEIIQLLLSKSTKI